MNIFFAGNFSALLLLLTNVFFVAAGPLPGLKFIANRNQWPAHVHYSTAVPGGTMNLGPARFSYYFTDGSRVRALHERSHNGDPDAGAGWNFNVHALQVNFVDANALSVPLPFGESREYYNFYIGKDRGRWASKVHAYDGMIYPEFYNNIDLKVYSLGGNVKYDFVVGPNGDPAIIRARYQGATAMSLLNNGDLVVKTTLAEVIEKRPLAYQYIDGEKVIVRCEYLLTGNEVSFRFPDGYDACYELVIDPLLIFSTYSGSTADNWGSSATPGEHGRLYSSGTTNRFAGGNYPVTEGVFQAEFGGQFDIGILKYDSTGSQLLYSTLLGGHDSESPHSLIMDSNEDLIVLGTTSSDDFPVTEDAFDTVFHGGTYVDHVLPYNFGSDIFVSRISRDGTALLASTFLGGAGNDGLNPNGSPVTKNYGDQLRGDVITDGAGNVYISSVTSSADFPLRNSFRTTYHGGITDAILAALTPDLSEMTWGAFLGGMGADASHTLKRDSEGNIFIAGGTASADFPVTAGGYLQSYLGNVDGWIAKIAGDGSAVISATFTGTQGFDQVYFLDLNELDEPYVFGQTNSSAFPKTAGVYDDKFNSGQFIQKFSSDLSSLAISTSFGSGRGVPDISPTAFLVNDCNNLYLSGWAGGSLNEQVGGWDTSTEGLLVTADAFQKTTSGNDFYFMVLTSDLATVLYATFLGGTQSLTHVDGGTSRFDKNGIVYHAVCSGCNTDGLGPKSDFPTTPGAWSRTNNSVNNCNNAAFKFDLSSLKARIQTNSVLFDSPGLKIVCQPDKIVFENLSTGGEIFEWDLGDGTLITSTGTEPIVHEYTTTGQFTVRLKAIDRGTCQVVDSTRTTVIVNKAASIVQDDDYVCSGNAYQLKAAGGIAYEWATADGSVFSTSPGPTVEPRDTTSYYVTIREANGCVQKDTVVLSVVPAIKPRFTFERSSACTARPFLKLVNLTDSLRRDDLMFFDFGDGHTADFQEGEHHFENDGVYRVRLVGSRDACVFEAAADVPVYKFILPNIITPSGSDGLNDYFNIQFGDDPGMTPADHGFDVSLTVYNRWGNVLLEAEHYGYDWSGEGLAAGVYFYDVTIEDHGSCRSWLQIVR